MFAQVFDDKNSTSLLTKGGHVEERDGVTRRASPLARGWLAASTGLLSCLVLRFMLDILITRLVSKA